MTRAFRDNRLGRYYPETMRIKTISESNIAEISRKLAQTDKSLAHIYRTYGPPPLWDRPTGFATLLNIILEQQVSLASAKACYDKLNVYLGEITPEKFLTIGDADLKIIGFSRQKTSYARHLSEAVIEKRIDLDGLAALSDAEVKLQLTSLKGVGEWTSDVYLLMAMLRPDVMPRGDVALHTAWHKLSGNPRPTSDEFVIMAKKWSPYRSVAARLLWHYYLSQRRKPER